MRRRDFLGAAAGLACAGGAVPAAAAGPSRGLWRGGNGQSAAIGRFPEFGPGDFLFDYAADRAGPLMPAGGDRRALSSTLDGSGPPVQEVVLSEASLDIGGRRLQPVTISRIPFQAVSQGVSLSAELASPEGRPRALVLMVYGSGPAPKEALDLWAFWFLAAGCAVATYDKRGSGRSGGDWRLAGLETLAADAWAVAEAARRRMAIAVPTLAWGASQGGWILPQLAAGAAIDAMLLHAGSAMTPGDQMLAAVEAELRAWEFPDDEIARAKAYYALDTDVSRGRRPWADVDAAYRAASGAEWILAPPAAAEAPERVMIRLMADFDPAPYWARSGRPALAIFGGKDWVVPAVANRALFAKIVPREADFGAITLPSANHLMFVAERGVRTEYGSRSHIVPGYFEAVAGWLAAHS